MKRQFSLWSAVGFIVIALMVGLVGGAIMGGAAGYTYARHNNSSANTTAQSTSTKTASAPSATTSTTPTPTQSTTSSSAGAPTTTATPNVSQSDQSTQSYNDVVAKVNPAVVTVTNHLKASSGTFGQSSGGEAIGTGMIIDNQGHIVTNYHVIDQEQSLQVTFTNGKTVPATLVGGDPYQDVAVIKVNVAVPATITWGDSSKLQPGQRVIAIGSALGQFNNTVTDGIVSAINRSLDTGEGYLLENLVQHDATLNHGNSGGPLINLQGQVVGMNTAIETGDAASGDQAQGLDFSIESNVVKSYAEQIIQTGKIDHPYLGIQFQPANQGFGIFGSGSSGSGNGDQTDEPVVIEQVVSGSPAAKAGLQQGDVLTGVNNTTFSDQHPFLNVMYSFKPGDTVTLKVQSQDGNMHDVKVTLGHTPSNEQQS